MAHTEDTLPTQDVVRRRVIGDTPKHGKYLLEDSHSEHIATIEGGLAFAIGVACMEAELAKDAHRLWTVKHPNGVGLYYIGYMAFDHIVTVRRVS